MSEDTDALAIMHGIPTLAEFLYHGRRVFLVADSVLNILPEALTEQLTIRDDQNLIRMRNGFFDTTVPQPDVPAGMEQSPGPGPRLTVVQFVADVRDDWIQNLSERDGLEIVHYMPENAYLVWADSLARESLIFDVNFQPHLQWVGPFHPDYKLHPAFDLEYAGNVAATIQLFGHTDVQESIDTILGKASSVRKGPRPVGAFSNVTVEAPVSELQAIAHLNDVADIEPFLELNTTGERQGQILAGNLNAAGTGPGGTGYLDWLTTTLNFTPNFEFLVDLTDEGLDGGGTGAGNVHPVFLDENGASRIAYIRRVSGTLMTAQDGEDLTGHGTINASIVGGLNSAVSGDADYSDHADSENYRFGLGIAPFVRLGATKVFDYSLPFLPTPQSASLDPDYSTLVDAAYADGARITNNSWAASNGMRADGCFLSDIAGDYNDIAREYDGLVRDAQPSTVLSGGMVGNQEMVVVFAAGNLGACDNPQLGWAGSTAKNTLVVGATESFNATGDTDGSGFGNADADNVQKILSISGRGPTNDGRVKPDLLAPGSHIYGAASQDPSFNGDRVSGAPGNVLDDGNSEGASYYPSGQTLYTWSSGTSQATPAISGAAALLRQWFLDRGHPAPSPAMTKAYLMNSATYLPRPDDALTSNDDLRSNIQGMGRVNLGMAFDDTPRLLFDQIKTAYRTATVTDASEVFKVEGRVAEATEPFRVTMAYTDAAGDNLVNNLNLVVEVGDNLYRGNNFTEDVSDIWGVFDDKNNVESVFLPAGLTGDFTVTVSPSEISADGLSNPPTDQTRQDFALVIYNAEFPTRKPVDIILVLDVSGSMNGTAPGGGFRKINLLKEAATKFIKIWDAFAIPEDRMGVTLFSNDVETLHPEVSSVLQPFPANADPLIQELNPKTAGGCTAMGAGLQTALESFDGEADRQRHIILFSNGMQNLSPTIEFTDEGGLRIEDDVEASCGDTGIDGLGEVNLSDYGIKAIHTIGTGVSGASWEDLLVDLAGAGNGKHHFTNAPDEALEDFFIEDLVAALRVDPVEKVATRTGTITRVGDPPTDTFEINATVRQATFAVSWRGEKRDSAVDFRLVPPNGTTVPSSLVTESTGEFYRVVTVRFPLGGPDAAIPHAGTWEMIFEPALSVPQVTYRTHLIVDDPGLRYYFDAPTSGTGVGEPIPISLSVQEGTRTLTGLESVQAVITRPVVGVGTWMARHGVTSGQMRAPVNLSADQFGSPAAKKAHILMQDQDLREELFPVTETIQLFDDGLPGHGDAKADDGVYSALYRNTFRPGSYDVDLRFQYSQDDGGVAIRSDRKTLAVSMERFDLGKSTIKTRWIGTEGDGFVYEVSVTPVDRYDNYLGPGHFIDAVVVVPPDKWSGRGTRLEDNLDGSYSGRVRLNLSELTAGAGVRIDVGGRTLGLAPLDDVRGWRASVYTGFAIPVADFGTTHDRGPLFEIGIGRDLNRSLSISGVLGRYSFDPSFVINGFTGYLRGYLPYGGMRVFGAAGMGYFKPENLDGTLGISPGLGLDWGLTPALRVEAAAHYFHLFSDPDPLDFLGVRVGLTYILP